MNIINSNNELSSTNINNDKENNPFFKFHQVKENKINPNKIITRERFLPEVIIDEVDNSNIEISLMISNTKKLNTSNNNIALKPTQQKIVTELKLNNQTNIKIDACENNIISTIKQKKFITMDSFIAKESIIKTRHSKSKENFDFLKKNLKSNHNNDYNSTAKSHNLLTFFKNIDIRKEHHGSEVNFKSNFNESKQNNKSKNENSIGIGIACENILKNLSDDNKNNLSFNKREKNLSSSSANKALINKFLLGNK